MTELKKNCCTICNFSSHSNYSLEKHLKTKKHFDNANLNIVATNFKCSNCDKYYRSASGLWSHNKKCKVSSPSIVDTPVISSQESSANQEVIIEMRKMNEQNAKMFSLILDQIAQQSNKLVVQHQQTINNTTNTNTNNTTNNTFNMNVFLNEKCGEAINLEEFVKRIMFEFANSTLMMESYVEGTCNIIQRNLEQLPVNKRPMHCLVGEDPHQQLVHIREDDKWNTSSELNWMQQIHADDDDDVLVKNPIYYALQKIDDKKLEYLAYNFYANDLYVKHYSRLRAEINYRPDLKEKVYRNILKMINLDTDKLDEIHKKNKICI